MQSAEKQDAVNEDLLCCIITSDSPSRKLKNRNLREAAGTKQLSCDNHTRVLQEIPSLDPSIPGAQNSHNTHPEMNS
eukprot:1157108-Pelagomonas_calceolata.AAC.1